MARRIDFPSEYGQLARRRRSGGQQRLFASFLCAFIAIVTTGYIFWVSSVSAHNATHPPRLAPGQDNPQLEAASISPPPLITRPPVDNISCEDIEQTEYHIHAHLTLVIRGQPVPIPANIGIARDAKCLYWLHTHDRSGVIHIESPEKETFSLGTFFHLWKSQFSDLSYPPELDLRSGWQVYLNGRAYRGNFTAIPLQSHALITMAYRSPNIEPDSEFFWGNLAR